MKAPNESQPKQHRGRHIAGGVLVAIGVLLLVLPGPGLLLIAIGLAMMFVS